MAAKEGDAEIHLLLGAVNQYPDADDYATLLGRRRHNFAYGAAGSEKIIHDKDSLAGVNAKSPLKSSPLGALLLGEDAPYS